MKFRLAAALFVVAILAACSGEEGAVRASLKEVFDAAKRGDIAFALDRMDAANPVSAILQHIRAEQGDDAYDQALAELGARSREALEERSLRIESIVIDGDRAMVHCVLVGGGRDIRSEVAVSRIGGEWRPYSLPGLPQAGGEE